MIITCLLLAFVFVGCKSEQTMPVSTSAVAKTPGFLPPTAEEAYRLQDDCSHRGEAILQANIVGYALAQEQVSRYNPITNRCYVRLEVHAKDLQEIAKYDYSTYLKDGQTGELLAFILVKPGGAKAFLGFGCSSFDCVSEKMGACMNGNECEPE